MKAFKKFIVTVLFFSIVLTPCYSTSVNALNNTTADISNTKDVNSIYGLDAIVRDCNELNIRCLPSDESPVICSIPFNSHLTVIDQIDKWFEVEYNGISGYVFWKYIKFSEPDIDNTTSLIGNSIIHYTSSSNRDNNINVACNIINGTILQPNESFVWSNIIGRTTAEKGFLEAPVIINKKSVLGLGGGVCQVSTTIYNALLDTYIVPYELHKHSIGSAYSKNDATVSYGNKDFAFTNSYSFPIYIEAFSYKSVVFINIYKIE